MLGGGAGGRGRAGVPVLKQRRLLLLEALSKSPSRLGTGVFLPTTIS